ncbi:hypothetical protein ACF3OH_12725 [Chryseomicrobium aureum]|uniref:hypothetical protein n=1 Tax=Chryseomicrobium aureum TaxID=1441723 RepID=UPI00370D98A5
MGAEIFGTIILWILGLLVLHFVIYTAVRDGINKSVIGQYINEKTGNKVDAKTFINKDLDND